MVRAVLGGILLLAAGAVPASAGPEPIRFEAIDIDPALDAPPDALAGPISPIIFVNRCPGDCIITPGPNDSRANTSNIIGQTTRTISEFNMADEVFDAAIECLRDVYGPYDVQIVTEDPGDVHHHETLLAGYPAEVDRDPRTGGIAPRTCQPLNDTISFAFANFLGEEFSGQALIEQLCWTVAQESAHSFGLPNHVWDCEDPMTYLPADPQGRACGRKYFRDKNIRCGEFDGPTDCPDCGVESQNSHETLLATFGEGQPVPGPEVTIQVPADGATVDRDDFGIFFTAIDPRTVERADVYFNKTKVMEFPGKAWIDMNDAYSVVAPAHPDGYIEIEIKAYNDLAVEGNAVVTVLKGEPCADDSCGSGYECTDGHCVVVSDEGGGCCAVAGGQRRDEPMPLSLIGLFTIALLWIRGRRR